jgi:hypothetical protein
LGFVLGQGLFDDLLESGRDGGIEFVEAGWWVVNLFVDDAHWGWGAEGGRTLARAGYTAIPGAGSALDLARAYAELPAVVLRATRANHARVGNLPVYAWRRLRAAIK